MFPTLLAGPLQIMSRLAQRLPQPVQDAAVSAYGLVLHRMRYGRTFRRYRAWLDSTEGWSAEEIRACQEETLGRLIRHCAANVPYYRELFRRIGTPPPGLSLEETLARIPILEKSVVQEKPEMFLAETTPLWRTIAKDTSGTTGTPMVFRCTRGEIQAYWAFADRARHWAGSAVGYRRATFSGMPIISPDRTSPPFWRRDYVEKKVLLSAYHLSPTNTRHYAEFLNRFRPQEILGHPSALSYLAGSWPQDTPPAFRPTAVITTGETLFDFQKRAIEARFGCRVSDQYSAGGEMGPGISMCEEGTYHEHPESGIIEVLDETGRPTPPGSSGQAVITGFINWTQPLLRYRVGDVLVRADGPGCPCGRAFARYARIEGKIADRLLLPDGRVLGNIYTLVESFPRIRECQFRQVTREKIVLRIVPAGDFGPEDLDRVNREARRFLGSGVDLAVETVPEIERTKRGKLRLVLSDLEDGVLGQQ